MDSARYIRLLARGAARAFVLEPPAGPSGLLKTRRKGVERFEIVVTGRAAHAGTYPEEGVSAILELSHLVQELFALNDVSHGVTVNVGTIDGGLSANVVAPQATALVDVRAPNESAANAVAHAIRSLEPAKHGTTVTVTADAFRPPMPATDRNQRPLPSGPAARPEPGAARRGGSARRWGIRREPDERIDRDSRRARRGRRRSSLRRRARPRLRAPAACGSSRAPPARGRLAESVVSPAVESRSPPMPSAPASVTLSSAKEVRDDSADHETEAGAATGRHSARRTDESGRRTRGGSDTGPGSPPAFRSRSPCRSCSRTSSI